MSLSDTELDFERKSPPVNRILSARNYHTFAGGHCHWLATIMHLRGFIQIYSYQQANLYTPATNILCDLYAVWVLGCCLVSARCVRCRVARFHGVKFEALGLGQVTKCNHENV